MRRHATAWMLLFLGACSGGSPKVDGGPAVDAGRDAGTVPDGGGGLDGGSPDGGDGGLTPLFLNQVLPPRGESGGGTAITLLGSGFVSGVSDTATGAARLTTLKFGSNPVIDFQVIDDNTIDLRTPPGLAGTVDVTLTNSRGSAACSGCFTYFELMYASSISPTQGPLRGGNTLDVQGAGFTGIEHVLVGGNSSPLITPVSGTDLHAVVPRGQAPGLVDVLVVSKDGATTLRRAYQYFSDLRVSGVAPPTGPVGGGTTVTLLGQGFDGATGVSFGGSPGTALNVVSTSQLTVVTPAATGPGAVDITVTTPRDSWKVRNGFTYVSGSATFTAYAVYPHLGSSAGGNTLTLTGEALNAGALSVTVGGQAAAVGAVTANTAQLTVAARGSAPRVCDVVVSQGATNKTLSGAYTYQLQVSSIAPTSGPADGGTTAAVGGLNLAPDSAVFVGALEATNAGTPTETVANVVTPPGSGGAPNDVWVYAASDPENEAVLPGAFTYQEPLSIARAEPDQGAISGNTLVSVVGAGFGDGTTVTFGAGYAKDVKVIDSHTLSCRTPRGDVGTVDVSVQRLGASDTEPGGFSYFDPRSISGGLSGGPLVGTLNISVVDVTPGFAGNPVPYANVKLGIDPYTPFEGLTDDRGQITFSDPALVKPQTVTVWRTGYQSTTVTQVSTENLTVLISQTGGGGSPNGPPPGVPPAIITGRVTGFKAPRPLGENESLKARVFVAQQSFYDGPPFFPPQPHDGETWELSHDGDTYTVFALAGVRATYAVMGIYNLGTKTFQPYLMGLRRAIAADPNLPATGQDIVLDMHLDMTVPVTISGPISLDLAPANNNLYAWMDLGDEGLVPNPLNWDTGDQNATRVASTLSAIPFPNFPELDGSNFIFLNQALSTDGGSGQSYLYARQGGDISTGLTIGPLLTVPVFTDPAPGQVSFDGTLSWSTPPGPAPDIISVQLFAQTQTSSADAWVVIVPGTTTQVTLPPDALSDFVATYGGGTVVGILNTSRSTKFNYGQWTYDSLSAINWTAFTQQVSPPVQVP